MAARAAKTIPIRSPWRRAGEPIRHARLPLIAIAATLALLSVLPATGAQTLTCGGSTNFWVVSYDCNVGGMGANGNANLCPPDAQCYSSITCTFAVQARPLRCYLLA